MQIIREDDFEEAMKQEMLEQVYQSSEDEFVAIMEYEKWLESLESQVIEDEYETNFYD